MHVCVRHHIRGYLISAGAFEAAWQPGDTVKSDCTHFGPCAPSGSCCMMSMSLSVQSPAERMWTLKKSSSGAEVIVNGCHSSWEMAGQLRKTYWPTSILKPFFTSCSSSTLDGRITIWKWSKGIKLALHKKKTQGPQMNHESNVPSCIWPSECNGWNVADVHRDTESSGQSPTSRSEKGKHRHKIIWKLFIIWSNKCSYSGGTAKKHQLCCCFNLKKDKPEGIPPQTGGWDTQECVPTPHCGLYKRWSCAGDLLSVDSSQCACGLDRWVTPVCNNNSISIIFIY